MSQVANSYTTAPKSPRYFLVFIQSPACPVTGLRPSFNSLSKSVMRLGKTYATVLLSTLLISRANADLLIGQTVGMTGMVAAAVSETITGVNLLIDHVNASGGVHGERIQILRMDDGVDPKRAAENARVLIEEKNALALFFSRGTPTSEAILPLLAKHGIALIAPSTGAMSLHKPVNKYVFNVRSSYQREAEKAVQHMHTIGLQRVAVVYQNDSFGKDALEGALTGFSKAGVRPVVTIASDRTSPDYSKIVLSLVDANVQAVLWAGSGTLVVDGVKALRAAGSAAQVLTLSTNASMGFVKQLGNNSNGVIVSQVFPSERAAAHPLVAEALKLARAQNIPELSPSVLEGFAAAKVLVEGLRRAGPKPTRAKVIAAMESIQNLDLGGGLAVSYSPNDHTGIEFTELSIISDGKFKR